MNPTIENNREDSDVIKTKPSFMTKVNQLPLDTDGLNVLILFNSKLKTLRLKMPSGDVKARMANEIADMDKFLIEINKNKQ